MDEPIIQAPHAKSPESQKQTMRDAEAKVLSQFNEDGILRWLFGHIAPKTRRFVEFGIGNGKECNTANLSIHGGWSGLLMDGNPVDAEKARLFYASQPQLKSNQVAVFHAFVTTDNINDLLAPHAAAGPTDLLSLDIDGNDLWVWRAITVIQPAVVVIEYNAAFGPIRTLSVNYDPAFERFSYHSSGIYHGASLAAMAKVGREKGYVLVGCESHGVNAFFVQAQLAALAGLVELTPKEAYYEHAWRAARFGSSESQFDLIRHLKLIEI